MTKSILFLSKNAEGSSTRYRATQYFANLESAGFSAKHHTISGGLLPFLTALYLASKSDIVILVRKTFPAPLFWLLRKCASTLIFDFDDAIFVNSNGSTSNTRQNRFQQIVSACDAVFAGNHYLMQAATSLQHNSFYIPTSVDINRYEQHHTRTNHDFTLVWVGSRSTRKYISGILPAIEAAASEVPGLRLRIIADFELHSDQVNIENIRWSESNEVAAICTADIGLAPLTEDNWTKGKCALKVLQYMAASLPVISSNTGANAYILENEHTGYLVNTPSEWTEKIITAYQNHENLKQMGRVAHQRIATEFDQSVVFENILAHITSLLKQ